MGSLLSFFLPSFLLVFEVNLTTIAQFPSDHGLFVSVIGGLEPKLKNIIMSSGLPRTCKTLSHGLVVY